MGCDAAHQAIAVDRGRDGEDGDRRLRRAAAVPAAPGRAAAGIARSAPLRKAEPTERFSTLEEGERALGVGVGGDGDGARDQGLHRARALVLVPTRFEDDFALDPAAVEAAITPRTKALFLGYPCNPTGAVLPAAAQDELAAILLRPETQVSFNLKKGSLPIRGDVDLAAANDCMKKGLKILAAGNVLPDGVNAFSADTQGQLDDLICRLLFQHDH